MQKRTGTPLLWAACLVLLECLAACGSSSNDNAFNVLPASYAATPVPGIVVGGKWMVYFADEASEGPGGTDLNGDGDVVDAVAVALKVDKRRDHVLGVAAASAAVNKGNVYLGVVEAEDGVDWNGVNGLNDYVLLHWSSKAGVVTYVDTLNPNIVSPGTVTVKDRVYYSADASPVGDDTTIRFLDKDKPTTPVVVGSDTGVGPLSPIIQGNSGDLIFMSINEVVEGVDHNGDGDALDNYVLALLNSQDKGSPVVNVGLAQPDILAPFDAIKYDDEWLVGFLVSEAAQGNTNLNDQALFQFPLLTPACAGTPDMDTNDNVLFYLDYFDFFSGSSPAINTGLAGQDRVVVVEGYVSTLSLESSANCDLNEDGDTLDVIPRWVRAVTPIMPPNATDQFHAVEQSIPGGSLGISRLDESFVIIVSEQQDSSDLDGYPTDSNLVGWLKPDRGFTTTWTFYHQSSSDSSIGTSIFEDTNGNNLPNLGGVPLPYAGPSYMADEDRNNRLGVTFLEAVPGQDPLVASINNNLECRVYFKDTDLIDALPVWLDFEKGPMPGFGNGPILDWDGVGYATEANNAGVITSGRFAFFRVSEFSDNFDYTGDGNLDDIILFRNPLGSCNPKYMTVSSDVPGPAIITDDLNEGAAMYSSEAMSNQDMNGDGDMLDLIVRYFGL